MIDFYRHHNVEDRAHCQWRRELETEVAPNDLTLDLVCRCLAKVLPSLPPGCSEILQQVDLNEVSIATYASRPHFTAANATVRFDRALEALKQRLIEICGACAVHQCLYCNCIG